MKTKTIEHSIRDMFKPSRRRLIVLPFKLADTVGNLYVPDTSTTVAPIGRVVAIGDMVSDIKSDFYEKVKEGDVVVFYKYAGASLQPHIDGEIYNCVVLGPDEIVSIYTGTEEDMKKTFNVTGEYDKKENK